MLESVGEQLKLGEKLALLPEVTRHDSESEPQGLTLAYSLAHLEESFKACLNEHLPRLITQAEAPDEILDALSELREELRHILYHIRAPEYFSHLEPRDG